MFMQDTWPAVHLTECKKTAGGACSSAGTCTRTRALAHGFTRWAGRPAAQTPACASGQTRAWFQTTSPAPGIRTASARWGPDLERRSMAQSKPRWALWAQEFWNGSSTFCSKQEQDHFFKGHLHPRGMGTYYCPQSRGHFGWEKRQLLPFEGQQGMSRKGSMRTLVHLWPLTCLSLFQVAPGEI